MDELRPFFPIAVPSSSGAGGVSPRVIILQDEMATNAHVLELALIQMMSPPVAETGEVITHGFQEVARSADRAYHEISLSAQSMNLTLAETLRTNVEEALDHWQNLATAKGPSDACELQIAYFGRQMGLLLIQAQELHLAFRKMLPHSL